MANPLEKKLLGVSKPARYIGGEYGAACKPWDGARIRWALAFPDVYEIGMSHLGLQILYHILNGQDGTLADRVYAPWFDMEELLKRERALLWGVESGRPLKDFDVIGITIPYELTYTNILSILRMGGVTPLASDRVDGDPFVIGGGCGAFNPEPVADFFDAILLGDGEEAVLKINEIILSCKEREFGRQAIINELSSIESLYIPSLGTERKIGKETLINIGQMSLSPIVSNLQLVHDRVGIEIQRGCTRGCRFCQAGMIYRPVRQLGKEEIINTAYGAVNYTGFEECSLLSLSAGDYKNLAGIISELDAKFGENWVEISLPSLRTESLNEKVIGVLTRSLHGGFTLAPEAATERLRRVINKGNTEDDLLAAVRRIFTTGWKNLKLYFMIGLPTETDEDIAAIPVLVNKVTSIGRRCHKYPNITVNISTFVPKSHTPFQWERQISLERTEEIHRKLKDMIRGRGLTLKLHTPKASYLEGIFARGGRRFSKAILAAYERGLRFDAWNDQLRFDTWMEIFKEQGIDPSSYLLERFGSDRLPWDHLFVTLKKSFLWGERERSMSESLTPSCMDDECNGCGVCDFKKVRNVIADDEVATAVERCSTCSKERTYKYRINFTKSGDSIFIGHLDLVNIWRRALKRAALPIRFSEGFNPRPRVSFANALPLGMESLDEWCEIELTADVPDFEDRLSGVLPEGINVLKVFRVTEDSKSIGKLAGGSIYRISVPDSIHFDFSSKVNEFYASHSIMIAKTTKRGCRNINIKDSVISLAEISNRVIEVKVKAEGASIFDFAKWFFGVGDDGVKSLDIVKEKTWVTN